MVTNQKLDHGYMFEVLMSLKCDRFSFFKVLCGVTYCQYDRSSGGLMCFDVVAFTANGALLRYQDLTDILG
jgi:hypothetical protein